MPAIPHQFDELNADWFNEVMPHDDRVMAVRWERIAEGVGLLGRLARVELDWASGGGPESVIVKLASEIPEMVAQAQMFGFYDREINFYREVGSQAAVRVPEPYHVAADAETVPFVLVIEDLTSARIVDQLDGCTVEEAVRVARAAARLHAPHWGRESLHELTWLPAVNGPLYSAGEPFVIEALPVLEQRWGHLMSPESLELADRSARSLNKLQNLAAEGPLTMCHYDMRLDNLLFDDAGDDVCVIDFQLMGTHVGPFDLAYFLAWSVTPEQRAACQQPMIDAYVAELASRGVSVTTDWVFDTIRVTMLNVVSMAVMAGATAVVENDRGEALVQALVERTFQAAADLHSADLLPV